MKKSIFSKFLRLTMALSAICFVSGYSQTQEVKLRWKLPIQELNGDLVITKKVSFSNGVYLQANDLVPHVISTNKYRRNVTSVNYEISDVKLQDLSPEEITIVSNVNNIPSYFKVHSQIKSSGNDYLAQLIAYPIVKKEGQLQKVISFSYKLSPNYSSRRTSKTTTGTTSPLSTGTWYKIGVTSTGIYKIDAAFFTSIGVNLSSINPKNIRIYGNGTGMLPEKNTEYTPEGLQECRIEVIGENDGSFDANDQVLFYAKGPHVWDYNATTNFFDRRQHLYADTAFYFLNWDSGSGKRIDTQVQSSGGSTTIVNTFNDYKHYEVNTTNILKTGKKWLGEYFSSTNSYNFNLSFPDLITSKFVKVKSSFAVRSFVSSGNDITVTVNGSIVSLKKNISPIYSSYTSRYAHEINLFDSLQLSSGSITVGTSYGKPEASSVAWLDYISVNAERNLAFNTGQLAFRNSTSIGVSAVSQFEISSTKSISIWDVSDPINVHLQENINNGSVASFKVNTDTLKEFVAFDNTLFLTPTFSKTINNQNLLNLLNTDYILVCPKEFKTLSQELATFHEVNAGLSTAVVALEEVYNEFSSGSPDITAIRNFMRYLYNNSSSKPKYLMLMGDGSYDYRDVIPNNTNVVPSFQSTQSYDPLSSFTSDDFYGMLDDQEDIYNSQSTVDIGIGRFPANTTTEVSAFIAKVKRYVNSTETNTDNQSTVNAYTKSTFGSWKNTMLFAADDGSKSDGFSNSHLLQTEDIIGFIEDIDSSFNFKKIYMDAYQKIAGPGGGTFPEVTREINTTVETGTLAMSYIGHGGGAGWADERILETKHIDDWTNNNNLPLFLTATCEFSRFDNPGTLSAGEHVILNPTGGAIALLTTVRLVFGGESNNIGFSKLFFKHNIVPDGLKYNTFGDAVRLTKSESSIGTSFNNRKFMLIGDPAVSLAIPKYKVITTGIKNELGIAIDTISALSKVLVSGEILNPDGSASTYNGIVFPTVYDVYQKSTTLDNNNQGHNDTFNIQNNIIFKGRATASNGKFSFEFIVPKDISYLYDEGKISYYLANETDEGKGFFQNLKVGGTSSNFSPDNQSPTVELFLNDSNFVNGGLTNEDPLLIAVLRDESGINTTGNGLGHDITAVLDGDYSNPIILNEFYQAKIDDYTGGTVQYKLNNLSEGAHQLVVKAWDVHNNSAQTSLDFIVANSNTLKLDHVLNYPNPFSTSTKFYFEHNYYSSSVNVRIQIFTISGKLVKTINRNVTGNGTLKGNGISWDGKDDYGDKIGRGVYMYKLEVQSSDGLQDSKIEKLVILN